MSIGFSNVSEDGEVLVSDFITRYGPHLRVPTVPGAEPSRTKQADAPASDINNIVKRYMQTGELPLQQRAPMFADIPALDYKESLDLIMDAQQSFAALPASVRAAFDNDPARLLEALDKSADPEVHQYLFDHGVFTEPPVAPAEPVSPSAKGKKAKELASEPRDDISSEGE